FQAEDGIRDLIVTGVQTCALPILLMIPSDQDEKRKIIGDFAAIVAPVRVNRPLALDVDRVATAFDLLKRRIEIAANEAPQGDARSEERRVGKECRERRSRDD